MTLLLKTISTEVRELHKNNVRFTAIGDLKKLPKPTQKGIFDGIEITKNNTGLNLCLALNYGSRQEMVSAVQAIAKKVKKGDLKLDEINETIFSNTLSTSDMPNPDLLIRTSGEYRLSNFLLWQCAYSEIIMTKTFWPAFREDALIEAILEYQSRERRFGKVSEQVNNNI
jgi:undecaprenyl diphosphate synthase